MFVQLGVTFSKDCQVLFPSNSARNHESSGFKTHFLSFQITQLENGANPFSEDNEGSTAFHEAAESGVHDALEILCQYKGNSTF